jgi:autotransporter adhesin
LGQGAQASGAGGVAIGQGSASKDGNVSVGNPSTGLTRTIQNVAAGLSGTDAVNVNQLNGKISGAGVNSFGLSDPIATGVGSTAVAVGSTATGDSAAAFGQASFASGNSSTALGRSAVASGDLATAVGQGATALGREASAFGQGATATGSGSLALGQAALASGTNTVAVGGGQGASAVADNSIAIGQGAQALATNSVALGTGTIADQPNTVSLGGRRLVNVAPGIAGSDAATMGQLRHNESRLSGGIAAAAALGGAVVPDQGRSFVGLSGATYNGEGGMAFGLVHHFDGSNVVVSGGVALGTGSSQPIGRFAVGWLF